MKPWRPLLAGVDADAAQLALDHIANDLAARPVSLDGGLWALSRGEPGIGLLFAYLAASGRQQFRETAEERLSLALEYAANGADAPWFWTGLAGVVWAVEHVLALEGDVDGDDPHEHVDEVLLAALDTQAALPFELMNGSGFDQSTSFWSRWSASSPSLSSQSPTLHDFKPRTSSGGRVSCAKSSSRGGSLIFFVTRKFGPFSSCSISLTSARYSEIGA